MYFLGLRPQKYIQLLCSTYPIRCKNHETTIKCTKISVSGLLCGQPGEWTLSCTHVCFDGHPLPTADRSTSSTTPGAYACLQFISVCHVHLHTSTYIGIGICTYMYVQVAKLKEMLGDKCVHVHTSNVQVFRDLLAQM